jgi:hypothetical protein
MSENLEYSCFVSVIVKTAMIKDIISPNLECIIRIMSNQVTCNPKFRIFITNYDITRFVKYHTIFSDKAQSFISSITDTTKIIKCYEDMTTVYYVRIE